MFLTKTYDVQDCWKYDSTTYSSNHDYNLQLPSSQYTLEFDILKKTNALYSKGTGGVILGADPTNSYFMIGSGSETNYYISRWGTNVTFTNLTLLTQNTWKSVKCEVNGTSADIIIDGVTYSVTGISADTSKLCRVNCNSDNLNVRNIKIKPL